ncbi:MAG: DNA-processing protein DprA [Polyangiaceae bacterium]
MASSRISHTDPNYPSALRELTSPPAFLFVRGQIPIAPAIAIVGTRSPSPDALRYTRVIARSLVDAGYAVWSGGALGIDQAAHRGALSAAGSTVLVAGAGLDVPYPPGSQSLFHEVEASGALVSIVEDHEPPKRWVFLARNAVIAAMTQAMIVIECPLKSGARNAIAAARKLGRPTWIAGQSPWSGFVDSVREELRLGARLMLHIDEVLESLAPMTPTSSDRVEGSATRPKRAKPTIAAPSRQLSLIESAVLRSLSGPKHPDELCESLEVSSAELSSVLMLLELEGWIFSRAGTYARVASYETEPPLREPKK